MALRITVSASLALALSGCGGSKKEEKTTVTPPGVASLQLSEEAVKDLTNPKEVVLKLQEECDKLHGKVQMIDETIEAADEKTIEETAQAYACWVEEESVKELPIEQLSAEEGTTTSAPNADRQLEEVTTASPTLVAALCEEKLGGTGLLVDVAGEEGPQCRVVSIDVESLKFTEEKTKEITKEDNAEEKFELEFAALCNKLQGLVNKGAATPTDDAETKADEFSCEIASKNVQSGNVGQLAEEQTCHDKVEGTTAFATEEGQKLCLVPANECGDQCEAALKNGIEHEDSTYGEDLEEDLPENAYEIAALEMFPSTTEKVSEE